MILHGFIEEKVDRLVRQKAIIVRVKYENIHLLYQLLLWNMFTEAAKLCAHGDLWKN